MQGSAAGIRLFSLLIKSACLCLLISIFSLLPSAQAVEHGLPLLKNFKPKDYNAGTQNWALLQDKNGLIYAGNNVGVLEFDGVHWRVFATTNQSVVRSLALGDDNRIYVGAKGDLGFIDKSPATGPVFVSWAERIPAAYRNFQDIRQTFVTEDGVLFIARAYIFLINDKEVRTWSTDSAFLKAFQVNGRILVKEQHTGLLELRNNELSLVPGTEALADRSIFIAEQWEADSLLLGSREAGFFLLKADQMTAWELPAAAQLNQALIYSSVMLSDGTLAVGTVRDGVFLLNKAGQIQGHFNKTSGMLDDNIRAMMEDQQHGLWVALDHGLARVEASSTISIFNHVMGLKGNVLSLYRHLETLYVGTSLGIFALEANGTAPAFFRQFPQFNNQTWDFISVDQRLLIANNKGVFQYLNQQMELIQATDVPAKVLLRSQQDPRLVWVGLQMGLTRIKFDGKSWQSQGEIRGIQGNVNSILEDADGSLWLGTLANGVYHITFRHANDAEPMVEHFGEAQGLPSENRNSVHLINNKLVLATVRGLFHFNQGLQRFEPDPIFSLVFPEEPWIRAPSVDHRGRIWMLNWDNQTGARQAGAAEPSAPNKTDYRWTSAPLYPLSDTPLDEILVEPDDIVWFGGAEGIFRFDPSKVLKQENANPPLIRKVSSRDKQVHYNGGALSLLQLAFSQNSLRIEYTVPRYGHLDTNQFQAQLVGYDADWSDWHNETYQDYTNLEPGQYQFLLRYKNAYGQISDAIPLHLIIAAPWYKQWWAYTLYALLGLLLIRQLIKLRLRPVLKENSKLEELVSERTRHLEDTMQMLEQAKTRAEAAAIAKSEFLANMSHEIRTPMNAIIGFAQLAQNSEVFSEQQLYLSKITSSSRILLSILNDILDFSKVEAGKLELEQVRFRLSDTLQQTKDLFIEQARQKRLELQFSVDPKVPSWLIGDPLRLSQVLINLLSNAIKFTNSGSVILTVDLSAASASSTGHPELWLQFSVRDTGIGLSQEQCDNLFQAFSQADSSTSRKYGGTGLGLSIAQRLVVLMGGQINVNSTVNVGSTFSFKIRCYQAEAPTVVPAATQTPANQQEQKPVEKVRGKILVVEDNGYNQTLARIILQHAGFTVDIAADGEQALTMIAEQSYQLILMDVHMPKLDGYEATRAIRSNPDIVQMPIIALTAHVTADFHQECLASGMNDFITKPFEAKVLISKVFEWV